MHLTLCNGKSLRLLPSGTSPFMEELESLDYSVIHGKDVILPVVV